MKKICVVTATRAEYGLLKNVIDEIYRDEELELALVVTGTHLSVEFGRTVTEIEDDGYPIDDRIDILMSSDNPQAVSKTMGIAMISFADYFKREKPDMLIVLGDRYELISVCSCAMNERIPIAHISGGETTEGAIDECVRHCITKMSYLHFPGCEEYRERIIQLGESPDRVFNYGDVGVENISRLKLLSKKQLEDSIDFLLDKPYAAVTFHPATLDSENILAQCEELFGAIRKFPDMKFIFTKANADSGGRTINALIDEFVAQDVKNRVAYSSLGLRRYLSLVKYSKMVLGNSSSGIVEAPYFSKATVNIGNRQNGRLRASSIIDCSCKKEAISQAISKACSYEFQESLKTVKSPYDGGETSKNIVRTIKKFLKDDMIDLKKRFYDVPRR